jgi:preprotein translocase SecE subunit
MKKATVARKQVNHMVRKNLEKKGVKGFVEETQLEMSRVTWPSRPVVIKATIIILFIVFFSTSFIAIIDAILAKGFMWITSLVY